MELDKQSNLCFLKDLYLKNFRNFKEERLSFCPEINLIEGNNAQGKTNLLEAIFFLSTGRSFRTRMLKELIAHEESFFYIEARFIKRDVDQVIKITFADTFKKLEINETTYTSFTPLLGLLPSILYAPEDTSFIMGPPQERRRFLDLYLSQIDSFYLQHLTRYHAAMKQRNALLKADSEESMENWESIMATSSEILIKKRKEAIEELNPLLHTAMEMISSQKDHLNLSYRSSSLNLSSPFHSQFQAMRSKEKEAGYTLIGPHRDDLILTLNEKLAKAYASEGQKRCAIVSLRFAQWQQQCAHIGSPPLLSMDDFGVHLDLERHFLLQKQLEGKGQVFLTSPQFIDPSFPLTKMRRYSVDKGCVLCS